MDCPQRSAMHLIHWVHLMHLIHTLMHWCIWYIWCTWSTWDLIHLMHLIHTWCTWYTLDTHLMHLMHLRASFEDVWYFSQFHTLTHISPFFLTFSIDPHLQLNHFWRASCVQNVHNNHMGITWGSYMGMDQVHAHGQVHDRVHRSHHGCALWSQWRILTNHM